MSRHSEVEPGSSECNDTEERILLNKVVILVFVHKVFLSLHNINVKPLQALQLF